MKKRMLAIALTLAATAMAPMQAPARAEESVFEKEMQYILSAQRNKTEYTARANKTKTVTDYTYLYDGAKKGLGETPSMKVVKYDQDGNVTSTERWEYSAKSKKHELAERAVHIYGDNRLILRDEIYYPSGANGEMTLAGKRVYEHNDKGKVTTIKAYTKDELDSTTVFTYDAKNRETEMTVTDAKGRAVRRSARRYDANGMVSEIDEFAPGKNGELELSANEKYDHLGNITLLTEFNGGKTIATTAYSYNTAGKVVESLKTDTEKKPEEKKTYAYDDSGNCVEYNEYGGKNEHLKQDTFKFDEKNRLVEKVSKTAARAGRDGGAKLELRYRIANSYDEKGDTVTSDRYGPEGVIESRDIVRTEYQEAGTN